MTYSDEEMKAAEAAFSDDANVKRAQMAEQVRVFLNTSAGKLFIAMAEQDITDGTEALIALDPVEIDACRETRLKILVAQEAIKYLAEIIQDGDAAVETIQREESFAEDIIS